MILRTAAPRAGAIVPLLAILSIFLLALVAFAVDIGYISVVQKEVQNAADAAALAGASQMLDRGALAGNANRTATTDNARDQAQQFSSLNKGGNVALALDRNTSNTANGDVICGRLDNPSNLSSTLDTGAYPYNSVQTRVRRNSDQNGSLRLFFGGILGKGTQDLAATATATYEDGIKGFRITGSGASSCKLLPFALDINVWNSAIAGNGPDLWTYNPTTHAYSKGNNGDGIKEIDLYPAKGSAPGNFGTVDIGATNNSTADLSRQILNGPNQADLDLMGGQIVLGADGTLNLNGDTGISAGVKDELASIQGQPRIIPLYQPPVTGNGNNATFKIVGFAGIVIVDSQLTGGNKHVTIQPEFVIDLSAIGGGSGTTSYFVYKPLRLTR